MPADHCAAWAVAATLVASSAVLLPVSSASAAVNSTTIVSAAHGRLGGGCSSTYDGIPCNLNWCAAFAKWAWSQGGVGVSALTWSVTSFVNYGDNNGTWHDPTGYVPQPGDAMIFGGSGFPTKASGGAHIGIVESVHSDGTLTEIGGNQSNAVTEVSGTPDQIEASLEPGYDFLGYVSPVGAPAPLSSGLHTSVVDYNGKTVVYATAGNGNIYENYQTKTASGPWSGWELGLGSPTGGAHFESSPSVFTDWYGKTVVDAVDLNGNVQENYQTQPGNGPWSGWHTLSSAPSGHLIGTPNAFHDFRGTNVVYGVGGDGNVYENWHMPGAWSGWGLGWAPGGRPARFVNI
ncbi:CHAP domain-containing protein [Streptosporangium sp. NPDC051023]|uniref:CHAP domain-containing protein n=1 Tax=Streptosporangium sp. NPDC051023 TaxID=3155410 RepID=UPI00344E2BB4